MILRLVQILCEELRPELQSYGGATWKLKTEQKGAEADTYFYVVNAAQVIGKREFDLANDPPPDIVVEIDKSNQSLLPEIWRCNIKPTTPFSFTNFAPRSISRQRPAASSRS